MKVFICIDVDGGFAFNKRRQSRDKIVIGDIVSSVGDSVLFISDYSKKLFDGFDINLTCTDNYLNEAADDDFCFIEREYPPISEKITELTIYRWNREYPADTYFNIDLGEFSLIEVSEFEGNSHEKITKEVYER